MENWSNRIIGALISPTTPRPHLDAISEFTAPKQFSGSIIYKELTLPLEIVTNKNKL